MAVDELERTPIPHGDLEAIATVARFLVFAERGAPGMMWGGHLVEEVLEAYCHIAGLKPEQLRRLFGAER